jgi:hypothetical protein
MAVHIRRVSYYQASVKDKPGEAYKLLEQLASSGVNLLGFNAIPVGTEFTQLVLFPENEGLLVKTAEQNGIVLSGPEHALLCRGDDRLGAFADIHRQLYDAHINVYASSGVTADCGRFGYLVYVKADQFEDAARVLGV